MNILDVHKASVRRKKHFRCGRGESSGLGKTSGRGHKGQKARSGTSFLPYFEGGQMPLVRKLPKRGFSNKRFQQRYQIVNLGQLDKKFSEDETVDRNSLAGRGLLKSKESKVKILAKGTLTKKLHVKADQFSKQAIELIKKVGGTAQVIESLKAVQNYQIVKLRNLQKNFVNETTVTPELLHEKGLIKSKDKPIKIIADGVLVAKLFVKAHRFSWNAVKSIRRAGGDAIVLT